MAKCGGGGSRRLVAAAGSGQETHTTKKAKSTLTVGLDELPMLPWLRIQRETDSTIITQAAGSGERARATNLALGGGGGVDLQT